MNSTTSQSDRSLCDDHGARARGIYVDSLRSLTKRKLVARISCIIHRLFAERKEPGAKAFFRGAIGSPSPFWDDS